MTNDLHESTMDTMGTEGLLRGLRELIQSARKKALLAVDAVQVQTCWEIGRYIVEFEQGGRSERNTVRDFCQSWLTP